jgi:hypothetical protein
MRIIRNNVLQLSEMNVLLYCVVSEGWKFVIENIFSSNYCVLIIKPFHKMYKLATMKRYLKS